MMIGRIACLAGLIWVLGSVSSYAACTGSGITWSCPAGATPADVAAAISSGTTGMTVTFATGAYSWSSFINLPTAKGVTLICGGTCTVAATGTVLGVGTFSGTNTNFYRISGFTFNESKASFVIQYGFNCTCSPGTITQTRIDHNIFNLPGLSSPAVAIFFGDNNSMTQTFGVIDHNTLNSAGGDAFFNEIGATNTSPPAPELGTANNIFLENNTITWTSLTNATGGEGCMDSWGGAAIVARYNTSVNCLWTAHGVTHGGGPDNVEFYNNSVSVNSGSSGSGFVDGFRLFHHQGSGTFIAFNNSFTAFSGKNSEVISMLHYRDYPNGIDGTLPSDAAQCNGSVNRPTDAASIIDGNRAGNDASTGLAFQGYPCWRQPGRDTTGAMKPMYVWNNFWSDTSAQISLDAPDEGGSPDYYSNHMQANRDWYNAVSASVQTSPTSPFNGSSGMGFGTLANRPTSCTTNSNESGGGVGYFATDQGAQGTLYQCSQTDKWAAWYTPYAYPHPLVGGAPSGGPPQPPVLQITGFH